MLGNYETTIAEDTRERDILSALGGAMYMHAKMAEDANKAFEAVEYLESKNLFDPGV